VEVSLATPEKAIFSGSAEDVVLITEKGQINVLQRHANLITLVKPGRLTIHLSASNASHFDVSDGVLKVEGDKVTVLCNQIKAA
jgi:F-type H+-transporting ATPase subunit epsilon